jgi:nicotinamidase-related amidase
MTYELTSSPFQAGDFLGYLQNWLNALPSVPLNEIVSKPGQTTLISTDLTKGFCDAGPLASLRIKKIAQPTADLITRLWDLGVRAIILSQDTHEPDAVEFSAWPPHCVRGTSEAEPTDAILNLPFFDQLLLLEKNSISSDLNTELSAWLAQNPQIDTFIIVGDCTDLCVYQLAMYLRLDANTRQGQRRVIVPANLVETYDRSVETAINEGGLPHPADLIHAISLYHMALNGIEVVSSLN